MNAFVARLLVSLLPVALVACAANVPPPASADVARLSDRYPKTTLDELQRGRDLYLARCTSCHAAVEPTSIPADRWPHEVSEMSERAGLGQDESLVVKYLVAQSLRASL